MKRYLITGASRGIGRSIAEKLAAPDHKLLLHGRNREALAKTCRLVAARSGNAIALSYDLRRAARVEKMIAAVGNEPAVDVAMLTVVFAVAAAVSVLLVPDKAPENVMLNGPPGLPAT